MGAKFDAEIYYTRAKVGYENLHGADHEKSLYSALSLFMNMKLKTVQDVRLLRNLAERMEMSLGEAEAIEPFQMCAIAYAEHGDIEEAREVWEKCLEYQENSLGLKHCSTLATVENLGVLEEKDGNFEIALEYFERALKGKEKALGEKVRSCKERSDSEDKAKTMKKRSDKLRRPQSSKLSSFKNSSFHPRLSYNYNCYIVLTRSFVL